MSEPSAESNICAVCGRIKDLGRAIVEQMQAGKEGGEFKLCSGHPKPKKEDASEGMLRSPAGARTPDSSASNGPC